MRQRQITQYRELLRASRPQGFLQFNQKVKDIQARTKPQVTTPAKKSKSMGIFALAGLGGLFRQNQSGADTTLREMYQFVGKETLADAPRLQNAANQWTTLINLVSSTNPELRAQLAALSSPGELAAFNATHPGIIPNISSAQQAFGSYLQFYRIFPHGGADVALQQRMLTEMQDDEADHEQALNQSHAGGHGGAHPHQEEEGKKKNDEKKTKKETWYTRNVTNRISNRLKPLTTKYNSATATLRTTNQKYNPLLRTRRRVQRTVISPLTNRTTAVTARVSSINQKYNPYERLKRRLNPFFASYNRALASARAEMRSMIAKAARASTKKMFGPLARSGASTLARAGNAGARAGARATGAMLNGIAQSASRMLAQSAVRGAMSGIAALTAEIWVPAAVALLAIFLIFFSIGYFEDETNSSINGVDLQQTCIDENGNETTTNCSSVDNPETAAATESDETNNRTFSLIRKAFAQSSGSSTETATPTPRTDTTYIITVNYANESKDIVIRNVIPENAIFIRADPGTTKTLTNGGRVEYVEWSLKQLKNPTLSATELATKTLPAVSNYKIRLTLRPRPGARDTHIINQAEATLDPIAGLDGNGTSGSVDTGSSVGLGCTKISNPEGNDWIQINALNKTFEQKVNEVSSSLGVCVPINLIKALVYEESGGGMLSENGAGYSGIMQVGPGSWCDHAKYNIATPEGNVGCGVEHLAHTYQQCNNSWDGAVTAYYAGHCIPNGAHDNVADGGSGQTDYQYTSKIINRWKGIDKL
jgi:hypothetical protein